MVNKMMPPSRHHAIDYIEFSVTDIAEAKRFYAAAFDWKFIDYGPTYAGMALTPLSVKTRV